MAQPKDTTDAKFAGSVLTPEVTWAQRSSTTDAEKNHIFLTIVVPDVNPKQVKLDIQPSYLEFTGYSESKKADYHVKLELYEEIDPSASKIHHSGRDLEFVLQKKQLKEEYWPRLLKDSRKVHFLKTDFDKWVDEDEQNDVPEDDDYMSRMGGMGGDGGFGGIDFSKLGGGAGMGGLGAGDDGEEDEDEGDDDEDDEEMPGLEQQGAAQASSSKSKIEEVA